MNTYDKLNYADRAKAADNARSLDLKQVLERIETWRASKAAAEKYLAIAEATLELKQGLYYENN